MPIPTPHKGEKQKDFIARCAGDDTMNSEYPDNPQRLGICYTQWKRRKKLKKLQKNFPNIVGNAPVLDSSDIPGKSSKATANYVKHPVNGHQCGECTMFRAPGSCTAVEGDISPNGHCKYWEFDEKHAAAQKFWTFKNWDTVITWMKVHQTNEGIDPENQVPVPFPIAADDVRAEATHIAWHAIDKDDVTSQDFPSISVPIDSLVATQPFVDGNRLLDHEEEYVRDGGFKDDDLPITVEIDGSHYIIDGHHRCTAAANLGAKEVQVRSLGSAEKKVAGSGTVLDLILSKRGEENDIIGKAVGGNMAQHIIGLVGPSGSRKSVVSKHLKKQHGFARIHAGKPIKTAVRKGFNLKKGATAGDAKDHPNMKLGGAHPRAVMEAMADAQHAVAPDAISHNMRKRIIKRLAKGKSVVVDGVRTPEQAKCLADMGGTLCRVNNGKGPNPRLPMDMKQAAIQCDHELDSSQGKAHLKQCCDDFMHKLGMPKTNVS